MSTPPSSPERRDITNKLSKMDLYRERRDADSRRNSIENREMQRMMSSPEEQIEMPCYSNTGAISKTRNKSREVSFKDTSKSNSAQSPKISFQSETYVEPRPAISKRKLETQPRVPRSTCHVHQESSVGSFRVSRASSERREARSKSVHHVRGAPPSDNGRRRSVTPSFSSNGAHRSFLPELPKRAALTKAKVPPSVESEQFCLPLRSIWPFKDEKKTKLGEGRTRRQERFELTDIEMEENNMAIYLDEHATFLQNYVLDKVDLEVLERWFSAKVESKLAVQHTIPAVTSIGKKQLMDIHQALSDDPSQLQLLWSLANAIVTSLKGEAFSIYKIGPTCYNDAVDVLTWDFKGQLPSVLNLASVPDKDSIYVREAARRGNCFNLTQTSNILPVIGGKKNGAVFMTKEGNSSNLLHVMYLPLIERSGKTYFVIRIWRSHAFLQVDHKLCSDFMVWSSLAKHFFEMYIEKHRKTRLTEFLLDTVKTIFEDMATLNQVIKRILTLAQSLVNADRASLFLVDCRNQQLVSTVFDLKFDEPDRNMEKKEIRIPMKSGIAGHVAISGESMNIPNAYADPRFNREVDEATGYKTTSILCMPVKNEGRVIGVVQMVNKREKPQFSTEDEDSFEIFSTFFGLALHHAKLYDKITRKEQKYRVALEVLSYHNTCSSADVDAMVALEPHTVSAILDDFSLDPFVMNGTEKCQSVIMMFDRLFDIRNFDKKALTRFILTVRKNYRDVPYHNFDHGWSVAQTMYAILMKNKARNTFRFNERLALFAASLCHDLDHRGYTNKYMSETASPLAAMYTTSTLEHHHFNTTVTILQQEGHNIFCNFSSEEYKEILGLIRLCILATDLAAFFPNLGRIQTICNENKPTFSWDSKYHRELAMFMSMTGSDLSASAKPWDIQIKTVKVIFQEFYDQGDKERAAGRKPIPMMDRNKPEEQPASQVGFLTQICIPCYKILKTILPQTEQLYEMANKNLVQWQKKALERELKAKLSDSTKIVGAKEIKSRRKEQKIAEALLSPLLENISEPCSPDEIGNQQVKGVKQNAPSGSDPLPADTMALPLIRTLRNIFPTLDIQQDDDVSSNQNADSVFAPPSSISLQLGNDTGESSTTTHPDINFTSNSNLSETAADIEENVTPGLEDDETKNISIRATPPAEVQPWVDDEDIVTESLKHLCIGFNCRCLRKHTPR